MPPRYAYWTIILEGAPTAFRAHTPEELLPTLKQLQARHPDTVMKWFARGTLWDSPEQERMVRAMKHRTPRERRTNEWRPGGEHKDPRARFKISRDEKRRRFAANMRREQTGPPPAGERKPEGNSETRRPEDTRKPERPAGPSGPSAHRPAKPRFDNRAPGGPGKKFDRPRPHERGGRGPDRKPPDARPERTFSDRGPKVPARPDRKFGEGRPPNTFADRGPRKFSDRGPGSTNSQGGPPRRPGGLGDQRPEGRGPGGKPPWKPGGARKPPFAGGRPPRRDQRGGPGRGGPGRGGPGRGSGGGQSR